MKYLIPLLALLLASCATKPSVGDKTIPRPNETPSVVPRAEEVRTEIIAAKDTTSILKVGLDAAMAELTELRKKSDVTATDLESLWIKLNAEQVRVKQLLSQLTASEKTINTLNREAAASDVEIVTLRATVDDLNERLDAASKWEQAAVKKVAVYDFFQRWTIIICVVLGIAVIIFVAIRFGPALISLAKPI